jgi:hypothetical protein
MTPSPLTCLLRLATLCLALLAGPAQAHKPSDAYLWLQADARGLDGRWDIALRDLDVALDLDANRDLQLTWGEVRQRAADIDAYVLARLTVHPRTAGAGPACVLLPQGHQIDQHSDGAYLVLRFHADCDVATGFSLDYRLFEELDPTHRGVTRVSFGAEAPVPVVLDPARGAVTLQPTGLHGQGAAGVKGAVPAAASAAAVAPTLAHAGFVREGVHHILTGYDHILFLLCLLLPSVLRRHGGPGSGHWEPQPLRAASGPLAATVTAFTLAHSITLGLASARLLHLSPRIIEPAIAATIVLAALNNLWPLVTRRTVAITFCFGLIHGFGFAEVLRDLDLPRGEFAWALLQFNLGVELGQLAVVAAAILPLYLLRRSRAYQPLLLGGGSLAGLLVAGVWLAERVFDFKLLPV